MEDSLDCETLSVSTKQQRLTKKYPHTTEENLRFFIIDLVCYSLKTDV